MRKALGAMPSAAVQSRIALEQMHAEFEAGWNGRMSAMPQSSRAIRIIRFNCVSKSSSVQRRSSHGLHALFRAVRELSAR